MPRTSKRWRYIFNTLTVVSLLLLLTTVGLWVDSYGARRAWFSNRLIQVPVQDAIEGDPDLEYVRRGVVQDGGSIVVMELVLSEQEVGWEISEGLFPDLADHVYAYLDDGFPTGNDPIYSHLIPHLSVQPPVFWGLMIPHWLVCLSFAILPAIWLLKWNKRRQLGPNACPACGYDLTGNESGECPECGHASESEAAEA